MNDPEKAQHIFDWANKKATEFNEDSLLVAEIEAVHSYNSAEGCGCASCWHIAENMHGRYMDEFARINWYQPDHEEEYLMYNALGKIGVVDADTK